MRVRLVLLVFCFAAALVASLPLLARGETPVDGPTSGATVGASNRRLGAANAAELATNDEGAKAFTLGGYVEAYGQWNFNVPSNGLTHLRGFDNRHGTFTLANVALDAQWDVSSIVGRVTLQAGHTGATYYLSEPSQPGAAGSNASDATLWRNVQQAYAGVRAPLLEGLLVQAGLFLSPIGPEGMAIKDNWNFSRSNLFFGLPFYHSGARATLGLTPAWAVTLAAYNGWNSVVDNNPQKSLSVQVTYTKPDHLALSALYFGGVERAPGAAEGAAVRHLLDVHLTWTVNPAWSLLFHANGGVEPNLLGTSAWLAGAAYARFQPSPWLWVVLRGDAFREEVPTGASAIFWPAAWVASGTLTLDFRPAERVSVRLEYRHDQAASNAYFGGDVVTWSEGLPLADRSAQDTVTAGLVSWF